MHRVTWKQRATLLGDLSESGACRKIQRHRDRMRRLRRATGMEWEALRQFLRAAHQTNEQLVAAFGPDTAKQIVMEE